MNRQQWAAWTYNDRMYALERAQACGYLDRTITNEARRELARLPAPALDAHIRSGLIQYRRHAGSPELRFDVLRYWGELSEGERRELLQLTSLNSADIARLCQLGNVSLTSTSKQQIWDDHPEITFSQREAHHDRQEHTMYTCSTGSPIENRLAQIEETQRRTELEKSFFETFPEEPAIDGDYHVMGIEWDTEQRRGVYTDWALIVGTTDQRGNQSWRLWHPQTGSSQPVNWETFVTTKLFKTHEGTRIWEVSEWSDIFEHPPVDGPSPEPASS